ncbi:MAG: (d)CMP kinase [Oscillospiraceae bacterium]|nr:(d)CMP kinase [Oscillospiraceae bacterium]
MSQRKIAVAIDGPAGAGKSTIARAVAAELGFIYVDTGALYRAVGLYGLRKNADTTSADQMLPLLEEIKVELVYVEGEQRVLLNGEDVSQAIRVNEASMAASNVSAIPGVRSFLFDLQKNMAKTHNVVMDGRDIGTVVLPEAQVKIFLTATPEERATRRYNELLEKGQKVDFDQLLAEVKQRDYNDSHRATAPLKQAEDAVLVDTTGLDIEQSIEKILDLVRSKL